MHDDELLNLMAARNGHFRYESGHHGVLWLDLDNLYSRPRRLRPFVADLARRLAAHDVEVVCGPMVGGAFVAEMIADELDVWFCWTERTVTSNRVVYELPVALHEVVPG